MSSKSETLFEKANMLIPGGVNSPVRAFKAVGGNPPYISKAKGCRIWDVDGKEYIDYVASWGPMILGHAHPRVVAAIKQAGERGTSYGANCEIEVKMAELIARSVPSIEKVRMVSSGTEATMSAIRLARAFTERSKIIKFEGCYHGHSDSFLSKAGSGAMTFGIPGTPGVTEATAKDTLNAGFNDLAGIEQLLEENAGHVAAIILEPVAGNMGVIPPAEGFLGGLRRLADEHRAVLIFDEVITGFRLGPGGAQTLYQVTPDLTTLGKIIGGGLPVGAFGGKKEIMNLLAPEGPVYQAGTLSGNPLALTAGYETLSVLQENNFYTKLAQKSENFFTEMKDNFDRTGLPCAVNSIGSMACFYFQEGPVHDYAGAARSDTELFGRYFRNMLENGVYFAPSQFEATFVSSAHDDTALDRTLELQRQVLNNL